jgi:hypothetical protein
MKLTTKQETFSKLVALDGLIPSEAYRKAYDTNPINQSSIHEQSSKLMSNNKVKTRIKELRDTVESEIVSKVVWDKKKIINELSINVSLGRETKQLAASNQAIKLIGSAVGNVFEPEIQQVNGTIEILHKLPDSVLMQLESMVPETSNIESGNNDSNAIEGTCTIVDSETV